MKPNLPDFWYHRRFISYLLLPAAAIFAFITACRRTMYRLGILRCYRPPVPLIVVGNISVGGNGKTPLVEALARAFLAENVAVGIVSRGYGGSAATAVDVATCPNVAVVGDEPLLLWQNTGAPVVVARKRADAVRKLLCDYPATRLILADDGLQHYALARDVEIAVIAADFGIGNGFLLPAGPLRESAARLCTVDYCIYSGTVADKEISPCLQLAYRSDGLRPLGGGTYQSVGTLPRLPYYALTAIARPERFFNSLRAQGIRLTACRSLPDHAAIPAEAAAFAAGGILIISGKDAVKTAAWPETLRARCYVADYRAVLPPSLLPALRQRLHL